MIFIPSVMKYKFIYIDRAYQIVWFYKYWCYYVDASMCTLKITSLDDEIVMVTTYVADGISKEYLMPTRGKIKCYGISREYYCLSYAR